MLVAAFLIQVVGFGIYSSYGIFFNPLLIEFGWSRTVISGAASLFAVMMGLFSMIVGGLNDRFGPRITVAACGFFWGLGYLLMSQVSSVWQLYLFYGVIIGVGMGGAFVPILSTVARWFVKRRSLMTGIVVVGLAAGTLIMPPITNWLIYTYDWRTAFIVVGVLVLVVVVTAHNFTRTIVPKLIEQNPQRIILVGGGI